jgi:hypothetical protein
VVRDSLATADGELAKKEIGICFVVHRKYGFEFRSHNFKTPGKFDNQQGHNTDDSDHEYPRYSIHLAGGKWLPVPG